MKCSSRWKDACLIGGSSRTLPIVFGAGWHYKHPSEIMAEIASLTPLFAGVTYERLEGYRSLQWPVAADAANQPLLYTKNLPS